MSNRPQPTQKQIILQQVMLAIAVFLGMNLMCNRSKPPVDPRSPAQILGDISNVDSGAPPPLKQGESWDLTKTSMYWADANLNWSTLSQIKSGNYEPKIKDEADAQEKGVKDQGKIKEIEDNAQAARLEGDILLADTQYKYALSRNDTNAMRLAFNTLQSWERSLQGSELWTRKFTVPPATVAPWRFPWASTGSPGGEGKEIPAAELNPAVLPSANWVAEGNGVYKVLDKDAGQLALAVPSGGPPPQVSGKELYDRLVDDIAARNQSELTYGVFPGYKIVDFFVKLTGSNPGFSYAFAAFLLALIVRLIVFPLVQKQLMWGRKMQQLAPLLKEIREQYTKDGKMTNQAEFQQKTMALYAEYGMNPLAGCLPAAIQFPLFISVYQFMLHYQFAFQRGTFLWINPSTSAATHGFLAPTLGHRDYVLIIIYGVTMVISTLLMPVSDPTQIRQQKLMGVGMGLLFTVMMFTGAFPTPAAFVLYWVFTNLLATAQSLRAYRLPMPPLEKVNTKTGGIFPMPPFKDGDGSGGSKVNGKGNGRPIGPISTGTSTGTPAKHKPKKRK
ncbi:MAG TPA: YidC/Oxa1 family membrane protein insertase [Fimbriimonadaceae bacterium]|nr:YidC/Oxa1 family membrane protein insertase [Fimbriimonadaceae bacterium]